MKVTSIFTAATLLFATPVTASGDEVASCLRFVEFIEQGFDHRDAGLSMREIETAFADRIVAEGIFASEDPSEAISGHIATFVMARLLAEFVFGVPVFLRTKILRESRADCFEND